VGAQHGPPLAGGRRRAGVRAPAHPRALEEVEAEEAAEAEAGLGPGPAAAGCISGAPS